MTMLTKTGTWRGITEGVELGGLQPFFCQGWVICSSNGFTQAHSGTLSPATWVFLLWFFPYFGNTEDCMFVLCLNQDKQFLIKKLNTKAWKGETILWVCTKLCQSEKWHIRCWHNSIMVFYLLCSRRTEREGQCQKDANFSLFHIANLINVNLPCRVLHLTPFFSERRK